MNLTSTEVVLLVRRWPEGNFLSDVVAPFLMRRKISTTLLVGEIKIMYDGFDDIEDLLIRVIDNYDGHRNEHWSGTIYHDQAKRFAEVAIKISKQLVAGEPIDYELRILEDEIKKPDLYEALKDPAICNIFSEMIGSTDPNSPERWGAIHKFRDDFVRSDPRDKESPLRLIWERISIDLAQEVIGKICLGADRVFELFRMVLKTHPSEETQQFLGRLARCYIWGFDPECVILCRSVLDTAFQKNISDDICKKYYSEKDVEFFTLNERIKAAFKEGLINQNTRKLALKIKWDGDNAVHNRPDITKDVFGTICDTLIVVEQLQKKRRKM